MMTTRTNGKEANMDGENELDCKAQERLNMLKLEKMKANTSFTKTRWQLLDLLNEVALLSRQRYH